MRSDMEDCEARNAFGFHSSHGNAIHASDDHSINKPLPWVALACLCGGLGFGGLLIICLLAPWRAQAELSEARMRAEFSQELAEVRAESRAAGTDAAIARNTAQKLEARLNERR